jgi:ribosomal protein L13
MMKAALRIVARRACYSNKFPAAATPLVSRRQLAYTSSEHNLQDDNVVVIDTDRLDVTKRSTNIDKHVKSSGQLSGLNNDHRQPGRAKPC